MYFNGHGVDATIKLQQSSKPIHSGDLNKILLELHAKGRYKEVFLLADTCEAESFFDEITAPNVVWMATSTRDESAYSSSRDDHYNLYLMDNFTQQFLDFLFDEYEKWQDFKFSDFPQKYGEVDIKSNIVM